MRTLWMNVPVQLGIELRLQDVLEHRQLRLFLGLERAGIVQHFAVAIAQNVGGEPAVHAQHARFEAGREHRLHQRLAGLEILAADRRFVACATVPASPEYRRSDSARRWRTARLHQRRIGVNHRGRDRLDRSLAAPSQMLRATDGPRSACMKDFCRAAPDHHQTVSTSELLLEIADVFARAARPVHLGLAFLYMLAVEPLYVLRSKTAFTA